MKKFLKIIGTLMFALALAISLVGCRISPALIDTVYTADADEIDPNPTARDFTDDGTEDDDAPQEREEDTAEETNTETSEVQAQQEDSTSDDSAYQNTGDSYSDEEVDTSDHAGNGDSADNVESSGEGSDDAAGTSDGYATATGASSDSDEADANNTDDTNDTDNTDGTDDIDNTDGTDDTDPSGGGASADEAPVKDVAKKVVTDGSGTEQEIPEDVYTVTAVGAAAPIVAMVGGTGRLVGTSESFTDNELGSMLLAASASTEVNIWWSDDGSAGISDEDFSDLLYASPDVCFEISGEATFSSAQIAELQEHGIGYLVLPELSSSDNLKDAVMIVAEALETNEDTGQSAATIANEYCDWVDECLSDATNYRKTLDYYSIYIYEWREDVSYTRRYDPGLVTTYDEYMIVDFPSSSGVSNGTGSGVAVAKSQGLIFKELWSAAGINNAVGLEKTTVSGYDGAYIFPYWQWFGIPEFSDQRVFFYTDYMAAHQESFASTPMAYLLGTSGILGPACLAFTDDDHSYRDPSSHLGGSERFPAIVVADEETKEAISNSPQWKAGFLDETSSAVYNISLEGRAIDIAGDYEIYVNPTGFANWAEGSVDSPLEAYWILCKISGGISESRLISEVRSFYSEFYGIALSDSQIENIINQ